MPDLSANPAAASQLQQFETILAREPFKGLKAILNSLSRSREALAQAVRDATSYEDLLARLGHRIELTRQIHVQDSYSRVGPAGGIKFVLPCYDIPTQSSLPTLIDYHSTLTTTPRAAEFFNKLLMELKTQLRAE